MEEHEDLEIFPMILQQMMNKFAGDIKFVVVSRPTSKAIEF
ncbi:hypothetical protein REC12_06360 [Desulfosporosinus sp. PR]|nr:hypothetical protein [Desulfosporosinus sp. PR]MDQ7093208.1 hypothetical protein [Desulfosporosinus sp. PR]